MPDDPGSSSKPHMDAAEPSIKSAATNTGSNPVNGYGTSTNGSSFPAHQSWLEKLRQKITGSSPQSTRDLLETALDEDAGSAEQSTFTEQERAMILRTLRFGSLRVENVMVPRADVVAIDEDASLSELYELFVSAGHSRVPVYRETFDDALGMVHVKDLMRYIGESARKDGEKEEGTLSLEGVDLSRSVADAKIRRDVLFVPPSMPVLNLLLRMQSTHVHLAIVVDEYGGSDGIVSIEDLVEEIVGEIEDEHDADNELAISGSLNGGLTASARTPVEDLETRLGLKLIDPSDEDIDTLGGLVFTLADRVPQRGELIRHNAGVEFEILDADPRRIKMLRVHATQAMQSRAETVAEKQKTGPSITVP